MRQTKEIFRMIGNYVLALCLFPILLPAVPLLILQIWNKLNNGRD